MEDLQGHMEASNSSSRQEEERKVGRDNEQVFLKDEYKNHLGKREEKTFLGDKMA